MIDLYLSGSVFLSAIQRNKATASYNGKGLLAFFMSSFIGDPLVRLKLHSGWWDMELLQVSLHIGHPHSGHLKMYFQNGRWSLTQKGTRVNNVTTTLHIDTLINLILPIVILRIVFLHDLALRPAWVGHWQLCWLKEPWGINRRRRQLSKSALNDSIYIPICNVMWLLRTFSGRLQVCSKQGTQEESQPLVQWPKELRPKLIRQVSNLWWQWYIDPFQGYQYISENKVHLIIQYN